jgi:Spy/CpxP family protein refolding chaperone
MKSRIALITLLTATLSAGGLMAAEVRHPQGARTNSLDRMSAALNLTEPQKQQAKAIFDSGHEAARAVRQELRQERKAVQSAIQPGQPVAKVEQLARNEGPALGNLAATRAAAFAKFYAVLTPAQQQKLASLHHEGRQHPAAGQQSGTAPK